VSAFRRTSVIRPESCHCPGMRTGSPGHFRHFDYTGFHRYSLTFCTSCRRRLFVRTPVVELVLAQISRAAHEQQFAVLAYCFMPDHLHLLVHGETETSECRRFIKLAKQYSGYYYSRLFQDALWQRYGFERTLRKEEQTFIVARYILNNPIRANLVKRVEDYPFIGSLVCDRSALLASVCEQP
jgi:REP-associated tyrosine transposase